MEREKLKFQSKCTQLESIEWEFITIIIIRLIFIHTQCTRKRRKKTKSKKAYVWLIFKKNTQMKWTIQHKRYLVIKGNRFDSHVKQTNDI